MKIFETYTHILKEELILAQGCTEPIAIALAAAKCRETLGCEAEAITVNVSGNMIKNVQGVIIPGTKNLKGVAMSAILGMLVGEPQKQLEILLGLTPEMIEKAKGLEASGVCEVHHKSTKDKLYIEVLMTANEDSARVEVIHTHTNFSAIEKNGKKIAYNPCVESEFITAATDRSTLSVEKIIAYADQVEIEEIAPIFEKQVELNLAISNEGLQGEYGLSTGKVLLKHADGSLKEKMKAYAAGGSDARMSGCDLPVVINSGSGNQGLTIASPVFVYAKENGYDDEALYRALAVANLIPIHIKTRIGRLSAFCGAVTAGIGVGCAIAYLNGDGQKTIEDTIKNGIADLTGVICDGAKPSCAVKIASSVDAAVMAYQLAAEGKTVEPGTGIIYDSAEATIKNVGDLASEAMIETDELILKIMTDNA